MEVGVGLAAASTAGPVAENGAIAAACAQPDRRRRNICSIKIVLLVLLCMAVHPIINYVQ
jgi:hypothetical protein